MSAGALFIAMFLDAIFGEPRWLWSRVAHPAVLMGRLIGWADARFNNGENRYIKGIALMAALVLVAWGVGRVLGGLGLWAEIFVTAVLLAHKSLIEHVGAVALALRRSSNEGRDAVAMIVGRDTADMDGPALARAAIESAAENFSDGVVAPAFWFLIGGLPGLLIYKITNTADSMIGYRTERHADFGWAAARFDDLLNLIPARFTALILIISFTLWDRLPEIADEARLHRSPNAGWPEAAMSRALGVALSGPRSYEGSLADFPFVNPTGRKSASASDIDAAVHALWVAWAVSLVVVFTLWLLGA